MPFLRFKSEKIIDKEENWNLHFNTFYDLLDPPVTV